MATLDFSAGIAWGYLGNRGDFDNPLGVLDDASKPGPLPKVRAISPTVIFRGQPSLFGGVAYQTPWAPLSVKLEYEGNDYKHEPRANPLRQDSPGQPRRGLQTRRFHRCERRVGARQYRDVWRDPAHQFYCQPQGAGQNLRSAGTRVARAWHQHATGPGGLGPGGPASARQRGLQRRALPSAVRLLVYGERQRYFYSAKAVGRASLAS